MWTPLGPTQSVLIYTAVSLFQWLFNICKIRLRPHAVCTLEWMTLFQGCLQGGVPTYVCANINIIGYVYISHLYILFAQDMRKCGTCIYIKKRV